jgi:hypothetical protein
MQSVLNEGEFFDIFNNMLKSVGKLAGKVSNRKPDAYYLGGSISKYTKNLVMSFPVLVDDSLSLDTAQMISKANEKNIASMLEMLFASISINAKDGTSGKDILKQFHSNIDTMSMDDIVDATNDWVANHESAYLPSISEAEFRDARRELTESLKFPKKSFPINSLNETSLNDYLCRDTYNKTVVYKAPVLEADRPNYDYAQYYSNQDYRATYNQRYKEYRDELKDERDRTADIYNRGIQRNKAENDREKNRISKAELNYRKRHDLQRDTADTLDKANKRRDEMYRDTIAINKTRILDRDFKKANELQPTMMIINFNIVSDNNDILDRKIFTAGIKCRMIAANSLDIVERLLSINKTQINFKNLIRANTGEIKLARDFILAIDQQKLDAKNDVKKGEAAKLWSTLKKRSIANNARKITKDKNDATAITTLVVSQDTVNYMIANNDFDINSPKNAKMIMDNYNLLCLVIADEANEVAKFLYDGNNEYEVLSYSVLEREQNDREYRKAVNMLMKQK